MKKGISAKELLLIGLLLIIAAYYFLIHRPITTQTEQLNQQMQDTQTQIDTITSKVMTMNQMQSELDAIYEKAGGSPKGLASYSNNRVLLQELNTLLNIADEFDVSFGKQSIAESVMRREITVNFTTQSEEAAEYIVETIEQSPNTYLVVGFASSADRNGLEWSSTMNLINYEYVSPEQEALLNGEQPQEDTDHTDMTARNQLTDVLDKGTTN